MQVYYDADITRRLADCRVAVIGYGSQGHAHALNLRDSGVGGVVIGLRPGAPTEAAARAAGFAVATSREAAAGADLVMLLTPDETHAALYADIEPALKHAAALGFAHGFAVHFGFVAPRADLDVFLVAPKGPGPAVRDAYARGGGLAALMAVSQDATGHAREMALAYAGAIGAGRAGIMATTFREECECDLFGEQVVLCGGVPALARAAYETLVQAGYAPEMAYFECIHEIKLIVDLIERRGIAGMHEKISNTAEYGEYVVGPRIVTAATRAAMREVLAEVQSGAFARAWMAENAAGQPAFRAARAAAAADPIEGVGAWVRRIAGVAP